MLLRLRLLVGATMAMLLWGGVSALLLLQGRAVHEAVPGTLDIALEPVGGGFANPVYGVPAPGEPERLYIVERGGVVTALDLSSGRRDATPLLDLRGRVRDVGDGGLYSVAFHPHYDRNGRFFVNYTAAPDGRLVVAEFLRSGDGVRPGATLLELAMDEGVHQGGQLLFGPGGDLFVSVGDGHQEPADGGPLAQDLGSLHGKILRLGVDGGRPYEVPSGNPFVGVGGARPEVWAYGFRNPWRMSIDARSGKMFVGDVGSATWEEIDLVTRGSNYGWHVREADTCLANGLLGRLLCLERKLRGRLVDPLVRYGHSDFDPQGGNAVVGGYVYRGERYPSLRGRYLYGDFVSGRVWSLERRGRRWHNELLIETGTPISSFVQDERGELYLLGFVTGELYWLSVPGDVAEAPSGGPRRARR